MMTRQRRKQRGQALVESALVTLTFLAMFIGTIDLGQILFVHQSLTERARDTLREAVVEEFDAQKIRNKILYDQATPPEGEENQDDGDDGDPALEHDGFLGLKASMISVNRYGAGTVEDRLTVRVARPPHDYYNPLLAGVLETAPIVITLPFEGE